tara:strand:- start:7973 stop:9001 length:1029 start_codon:yes stop_codon:yes gene_type:complete
MIIKIAEKSEIDDIQSFINSEWKEGHILARDKSFFKYEYLFNDKINFIISKTENEIQGILGFIPSKIDTKNKINYIENDSDFCATLWKVKKNNINPSTGLKLLQYLRDLNGSRVLFCVGINKKTLGIYRYLGIYTGLLNHFVMINNKLKRFEIASVSNSNDFANKHVLNNKFSVKIINSEIELSEFNFEKFKDRIPFKNKSYFTKRYFEHPIYQYKIYGVYFLNKLDALFVTRIQQYNDSKVVRIIDFYGEENKIKIFGNFLSDLIIKEKYEYADFYCFGIDNLVMESSGFKLINQNSDDLIVPNYFKPFSQKNIPIYFFVDSKDVKSVKLFKGDGDQDRPN